MDIRKQFAKNLTQLMKANGKRQQDLMQELGYSSSTLSQWCNGKFIPRPSRVEGLARYFGVSVDALYAGADPVISGESEIQYRAQVEEIRCRLEKVTAERDKYKDMAYHCENELEAVKRYGDRYRSMIETLKADGAKEISIKF